MFYQSGSLEFKNEKICIDRCTTKFTELQLLNFFSIYKMLNTGFPKNALILNSMPIYRVDMSPVEDLKYSLVNLKMRQQK